MASTLFDNTVDRREPHPSSLARRFRCEEWFEDSSLGLRVHAAATVTDCQDDIAARSDIHVAFDLILIQNGIGRFNRQLSTLRHSISGVDGQVKNDLFDLSRVRFNLCQ